MLQLMLEVFFLSISMNIVPCYFLFLVDITEWLASLFESAGVCRITIFFMGRKSVPKLRKDLASSLFSAP